MRIVGRIALVGLLACSAASASADERWDQAEQRAQRLNEEIERQGARWTAGVTWVLLLDEDGDGYGVDDNLAEACDAPDGYVGSGGDCDDEDDAVFPGQDEACDGIDNDCDGAVDEGACGEDDDGSGNGDGDLDDTGQSGCQCSGSSGPSAGPVGGLLGGLVLLAVRRRMMVK